MDGLFNCHAFYTAGEKEVRVYPVHKGGMSMRDGAGLIHTSFTDRCLGAEVWPFKDLIAAGSKEKCGKKKHPKDSLITDGDVIEFTLAPASAKKKKAKA